MEKSSDKIHLEILSELAKPNTDKRKIIDLVSKLMNVCRKETLGLIKDVMEDVEKIRENKCG